jgi:hypothetical protein
VNPFKRIRTPVDTARETLDAMSRFDFRAALRPVMEASLWKNGQGDDQFPAFALSRKGLAANTQEKAELLAEELLWQGRYLEAAQFLDHIARPQGRPPNNDSNGANIRFFEMKRGVHTRINMVLWLHRHQPALFEKVCRRELSLRSACVEAGHIKRDDKSAMNAVLRIIPGREAPEQAGFLGSAWRKMNLSAQIRFIETEIDPALPPNAKIGIHWRKIHDTGHKR